MRESNPRIELGKLALGLSVNAACFGVGVFGGQRWDCLPDPKAMDLPLSEPLTHLLKGFAREVGRTGIGPVRTSFRDSHPYQHGNSPNVVGKVSENGVFPDNHFPSAHNAHDRTRTCIQL